jgi:hypothetical protein
VLDKERLFDESIEMPKVKIGKMLGREGSDWQTDSQLTSINADNSVKQPQQRGFFEKSSQSIQQTVVRDAIEILPYVHFEEERIPSCKLASSLYNLVSSFPESTCVCVVDKPFFKNWFAMVHQRMM